MNSLVQEPVSPVNPMLLTLTLVSTLGSNLVQGVDYGEFINPTQSAPFMRKVGGPSFSWAYSLMQAPTKADFEAVAMKLASGQVEVDEEIRSLTSSDFVNYLD